MIRFVSPRLQVSIGLLSLTVSLIFIASSLGLLPNEGKAEAQARATLSGALAVQLASLASRNEAAAVQETIDSVVDRSPDILSIQPYTVAGFCGMQATSPTKPFLITYLKLRNRTRSTISRRCRGRRCLGTFPSKPPC